MPNKSKPNSPLADITLNLIRRIAKIAYKKQKKNLKSFVGKYIERNGTIFLLVKADNKQVVLSMAGTPIRQTMTMTTKAFLGKKITEYDFSRKAG